MKNARKKAGLRCRAYLFFTGMFMLISSGYALEITDKALLDVEADQAGVGSGAGIFGRYVSKLTGKGNTVDDFDALKKKLRSDPETFDGLRWQSLSAEGFANCGGQEKIQILPVQK